MTPTPVSDSQALRIAAIAAAVQAYLDGEDAQVGDHNSGMSAWRRDGPLQIHDAFAGGKRSWTGRN